MTAKKKIVRDEKEEDTHSLRGDGKKQLVRTPRASKKSSLNLKGQTEKALKERIKELNCFFGISAVMELPDITLDEILEKIVLLIPPAWQFPEITEACIVLEGKSFQTAQFQKISWILTHDITVNGNPVGQVMICYLKECPVSDEGPFMKEERHLLNAIAERLGHIIERKFAETALKESEEKFREIFNTVNDGIHIHEIEPDGKPGKFIEVNDIACQMLHYTHDEMLEHGPLDFVTGYHSKPLNEIIREQSTTGHSIFETDHLKKDGSIFPVEINTHVVNLQGNRVMVSVVRDITERKRAELALWQAHKKLNLLYSITRHDINNHISAIAMFLYLAEEGITDSTIREHLMKIEQATMMIQKQIRFTSEYEAIGVNIPIWQDIRKIVEKAAKQAPLDKIIMKNELPDGVEVFSDPLIVKVCYNLVDNAVRYGGKISTIRFSIEERNGNHIVVCEDNGDGVVAEEKERIFDRGFGKNAGLGLALAREILDITGITIRETGEPGQGARFEMVVPKDMWRIAGKIT